MSDLKLTGTGTVKHQGVETKFYEFDYVNKPTAGGDSPQSNLVKEVLEAIVNENNKNASDLNIEDLVDVEDVDMAEIDCPVVQNGPGRRRQNKRNNKDDDGGDGDDPFKHITLDSVGGLETQIKWIQQSILKPLKDNGRNPWGLLPPKGVLFYGPPGTGKTLLARAFGNELSKNLGKRVKFYHQKGPECSAVGLGESSNNLRKLFAEAIRNKPSILFFDELDGLCPSRDGPSHMCQADMEIVTTLLGLMDNLPKGEVFVIGATNRIDAVDPAMRRPGRFDKHLEFLPPNFNARKKIVTINTQKWKRCQPDEDLLKELGQKTVGFTGADIEKLCRETLMAAIDRHDPDASEDACFDDLQVLHEDWETALTKTRPSNSGVFGSTLYVPQPPNKRINKLVENIQKEILDNLTPFIPRPPQTAINVYQATDASTEVSSFMLYNKGNSAAEDVSLESMILPGVFADEKLTDMPIYILSQEHIEMTPQSAQLSKITNTIDQAAKSFKPCILFIPRVDRLDTEMRNWAPYIARQLMELRGKPVLILATSSSNLPVQSNLKKVFQGEKRSFFVRKPNRAERETFFEPIFSNDPKLPKGQKDEMEKLKNDAMTLTEHNPIGFLLGLYDALLVAASKYSETANKQPMLNRFRMILKDYKMNKLRLN